MSPTARLPLPLSLCALATAALTSACSDATLHPITGPDGAVSDSASPDSSSHDASSEDAASPPLDGAVPDAPASDAPTSDAPRPASFPRLFVALPAGDLLVWDTANRAATGASPTVTVPGAGGSALALDRDRLVVAGPGVKLLDGASTLDASATPVVVSSTGTATNAAVDAAGGLWVAGGSIRAYGDTAALGAGASPRATFTHPFDQIADAVFDPASGRLYAAQVSGAGMLVWNSAATREGTVSAPDFALAAGSFFGVALAGARLWTAGCAADACAGHLGYNWDASAATAPRAPDVTLRTRLGAAGDDIVQVRVDHDVLLVVLSAPADPPSPRVQLYRNASTLTADRAPDAIASDASLRGAHRARLGADDTLYVVDDTGIAVFADATTAPRLTAHLPTPSTAGDLLVLE